MLFRIIFTVLCISLSVASIVNMFGRVSLAVKTKFARYAFNTMVLLASILLAYIVFPSFIMFGISLLSTCLVVFVFSYLTFKHKEDKK